MEERKKSLAERRQLRTLKIDLAIQRHQQLHCLQLTVVRGKQSTGRTSFVDKLVGEILDRVAEDLECATGLWADPAPPIRACTDRLSGMH